MNTMVPILYHPPNVCPFKYLCSSPCGGDEFTITRNQINLNILTTKNELLYFKQCVIDNSVTNLCRALDDIRDSIKEMKYYKDTIFK